MSYWPSLKQRDLWRILRAHGWSLQSTNKHYKWVHPNGRIAVISIHASREFSGGILQEICKTVGLVRDDLLNV